QESGDDGAGQLAFWRREHVTRLPPPDLAPTQTREQTAESILERLRQRGASFVTDLAAEMGLAPSAVRAALWTLLRQGLVTNDRFDVIRRGEESATERRAAATWNQTPSSELRSSILRSRFSMRRRAGQHPEGRWSLLPWGHPDTETRA